MSFLKFVKAGYNYNTSWATPFSICWLPISDQMRSDACLRARAVWYLWRTSYSLLSSAEIIEQSINMCGISFKCSKSDMSAGKKYCAGSSHLWKDRAKSIRRWNAKLLFAIFGSDHSKLAPITKSRNQES